MKKLHRILSAVLCVCLLAAASGLTAIAQESSSLAPTRISVCVRAEQTAKGFCWYTDEATESRVRILDGETDVTSALTLSQEPCSEWEGKYMHKVTVSGLTPGKVYGYYVGNGTVWSEKGSFVTDDGDGSFNFITVADIQASNLENFAKGAVTIKAALSVMPDAEFIANCGDMTNDSTNEEWDMFDSVLGSINRSTTLVPVAGNHDGSGVWNWFNNMFNLDTRESVQTKSGVNYSFDYGNAHFAVLNSNDLLVVSDSQLKWLENDMNGTDKDWKIVLLHKSPYSLGKDAKWPDALSLQTTLTRVLDRCNVDIVFSGHDHMYLRTKPLTGNKPSEDGVTYVMAGTAGSKRYEIRSFLADSFLQKDHIAALTVQKGGYGNYWNGTDWLSTKDSNVGGCFNCISIDGGTLTLKSYILCDETQQISNIDTYTVTKATGQNTATFSGDNTTSSAEYYLSLVPTFFRLAAYSFGVWLPKFIWIVPEIIKVYINEGTF